MNITLNERIRLQAVQDTDTQQLYSTIDKNRRHLSAWMSWVNDTNAVADSEFFLSVVRRQHEQALSLHLAIYYDHTLCGVCGFNALNNNQKAGAIGYWLAEAYQGKGIMTRCVNELLNIGFNELRLHKIEIRCAEHNYKSRAIAERLGFLYEATLRDCEWLYDRYVNHAVYSKVASEHHASTIANHQSEKPLR
ncbi:GNAT family protein [uncultured Gilvimarinus sp.]|uniref:GNAT family N-acetyltransferase n=1 Tax=uncultured Gilvimarinus sp. TaxID=1689143 RepID=UPI0030EC456C